MSARPIKKRDDNSYGTIQRTVSQTLMRSSDLHSDVAAILRWNRKQKRMLVETTLCEDEIALLDKLTNDESSDWQGNAVGQPQKESASK